MYKDQQPLTFFSFNSVVIHIRIDRVPCFPDSHLTHALQRKNQRFFCLIYVYFIYGSGTPLWTIIDVFEKPRMPINNGSAAAREGGGAQPKIEWEGKKGIAKVRVGGGDLGGILVSGLCGCKVGKRDRKRLKGTVHKLLTI